MHTATMLTATITYFWRVKVMGKGRAAKKALAGDLVTLEKQILKISKLRWKIRMKSF